MVESRMDDIIKTTAKFQEANQPVKQKPIIQIEGAMPTAVHLAVGVRPSNDSGRDNPFRPDGEIYKSADPIVDQYKFGLNPSRTQSPSSSQADDGSIRGPSEGGVKQQRQRSDKRSCWRRWLCCCCFRSEKDKRPQERKNTVVPTSATTGELIPNEDDEIDLEISKFLRNKELEGTEDEKIPTQITKQSISTMPLPAEVSKAREKFFSEITTVSLKINDKPLDSSNTDDVKPPKTPETNKSTHKSKSNQSRCIIS